MSKAHKRHIAKTITWRVIGTIDTIVLSWFITGDPITGVQIGMAEVVTKMVLYYLHERVWFNLEAGLTKTGNSRKRHIAKTFTWRMVGTLDTMILAWVISGDPMVGLKVGAAEIITKIVLYYLHERVWYNLDYGLTNRRSKDVRKYKSL